MRLSSFLLFLTFFIVVRQFLKKLGGYVISNYFKYVLLAILVLFLVVDGIIFLRLTSINNKIDQHISKPTAKYNKVYQYEKPSFSDANNVFYILRQGKLKINVGANYYRKNRIDSERKIWEEVTKTAEEKIKEIKLEESKK